MPRKRPAPASTWAASTSLGALAQPEVGVAHDAGDDGAAALAGAALLEGELGLADRAHRLRAVGAVAGQAVDVAPWPRRCGRHPCPGAAPRRGTAPSGGSRGGGGDRRWAARAGGSPRAPGRARWRARESRRRSQPRQGVAGEEAVDDVGRGVGERAVEAAERVAAALGVGVVGGEQVQRGSATAHSRPTSSNGYGVKRSWAAACSDGGRVNVAEARLDCAARCSTAWSRRPSIPGTQPAPISIAPPRRSGTARARRRARARRGTARPGGARR